MRARLLLLLLAFPLAPAACLRAKSRQVLPPSVYVSEWQAARDRFLAAQVRLHEHLLAFSASDLDALVDAENRLGRQAKDEISRLATEGAAHAEAARSARPDGVEGHLYAGLNLALTGLAKTSAQALLEGLPGRIRSAYEEAIRLDGTYEAGGAYRLKGKFLASAPWPVGDKKAATQALRKANEIRPVPMNHLFLGDLHHRAGRPEEAVAAWRRVEITPSHASTRPLDGYVRELARRRVAFAARLAE